MKKFILLAFFIAISGCKNIPYMENEADKGKYATIYISSNLYLGASLFSLNGKANKSRKIRVEPGIVTMKLKTHSKKFYSEKALTLEFEVMAGEKYEVQGFSGWDTKNNKWDPLANEDNGCVWRPVVDRFLKSEEPKRSKNHKKADIPVLKYEYGDCRYKF
jgi:hypothetical protein